MLRTYTVSHLSPGTEVLQSATNTCELEPKYCVVVYNQPYNFVMTDTEMC
jgi:hypothetical protein